MSPTCLWLDLPPSELQRRLDRESGDRPPLTDPGSGTRGSVDEVPEIHNRRLSLYGGLAEFGLRTDGFAQGQVPDGLIPALRAALFENE